MTAKTIGKEQAQQTHRAFYHASLLKSAGLPCAALKKRRATKPFNEIFPVLIQKRFVSHHTLNHKSIPTSKNILTPMRKSGEREQTRTRPCIRDALPSTGGNYSARARRRCLPRRKARTARMPRRRRPPCPAA